MRALVQRVSRGEVRTDGRTGAIGRGLVVLLGVGTGDSEADADWLAAKAANLRIFSNEEGKFDRSVLDVKGEALVVSQFTLYGSAAGSRRPDFTAAARPPEATRLYEYFCGRLSAAGVPVKTGVFGAHMEVELVNDGPVTIWLDSAGRPRGKQ